ncbi:DUF4232 domain-containing protein [Klenkia sp. PcliD-1-E]|uniref:DUF4232 domain-containing protein n=1 Tax=Klenkia sp. PcliD-1-E TaxID=2954492 RepID=UPI0020982709|nr:DUF4232 domain-containing protein [Klenkia sp. PcliD-1-E]MCO7220900.1 DUF4232 domain-containing protein [Klenkia sp. PcliD-1-E]
MTNPTKRLALPVLLAAGVLTSACSFSGGTEDAAAATSSASPSASTPATTSAAASSSAPAPTATSASSVPAATAAPEPSGADPTTTGGPDRCHTSELTGSLSEGDAAAGNRYATLTLTNTGGEVCTVYGYGGLGLVGQDGSSVPSQQIRVDSPAPRTVTLQPGQAVSATLHWGAVATGPEPTSGQCEPTPARLTVIPPNETDALSVTWTSGPVCDFGHIEQTAYAAA